MFPKGCLINRKCLLRRWIAEGFVVEKDGKTVEEVAEHCFSIIIQLKCTKKNAAITEFE